MVTKLLECMHLLKMDSFRIVTKEDNDIDEQLGNYNNCLTGMDQKSWFAHEEYLRQTFNMRTLDQSQYKLLQNSERGKRHIMNTPNYDILSNHYYSDSF